MPVLASQRERKSGGIGKPCRHSMHDLGYEGERLKGARPHFFDEKQRSEIAEVALVSESENGTEPLQIDIGLAYIVVHRHDQLPYLMQRFLRLLMNDFEHGVLREFRLRID